MGLPHRLYHGAPGEGEGDGAGMRPDDLIPIGPRMGRAADSGGASGPLAAPYPRCTTVIPLYLAGGRPYTVITRSFAVRDVPRCTFCPGARCIATGEGVCTHVAPGHMGEGEAAVYSIG